MRFYSLYKVRNGESEIAKLNGIFLVVFSLIGLVVILAVTVLVANTERIFGDNLSPYELRVSRILMLIMVFNVATSFRQVCSIPISQRMNSMSLKN